VELALLVAVVLRFVVVPFDFVLVVRLLLSADAGVAMNVVVLVVRHRRCGVVTGSRFPVEESQSESEAEWCEDPYV
jgi:hypothetical protein